MKEKEQSKLTEQREASNRRRFIKDLGAIIGAVGATKALKAMEQDKHPQKSYDVGYLY